MRFVCMSDVHCATEFDIPEGDVLLDAGDMTFRGDIKEIAHAATWREGLKKSHGFKNIVCIAGNHDWLFETNNMLARQIMAEHRITYLQDEAVTIMPDGSQILARFAPGCGGVTIYGSPWQPEFMNWAFNLPRGDALKAKWDMIPRVGLDVLITHGPPHNILDGVPRSNVGLAWGSGEDDFALHREAVGCWDLRQAVMEIKPKLHLFGHVHTGYGRREMLGTTYINASVMDRDYDPTRPPHVFDLDVKPCE